jgi:Zn-finger nucleic acid-binding protein
MRTTNKKCPVCGEPFERITYEGVGAMRCTGCGGYLINRNRLKGIQRRKQYPREALERSLEHTTRSNLESKVLCPKCRTPMQKNTHSFGVKLELDVCPDCQSVWLDPGELEQAQMEFEESLTAQDLERMKRTWQEMSPERRRQFEINRERLPDRPIDAEPGFAGLFLWGVLGDILHGRRHPSLFTLLWRR